MILKLIYLLLPAALANMTPRLMTPLLSRLALTPIDFGWQFRGKPIFGSHKTWGGLLLGIMAALLTGYLQFLLYPYLRSVALLDYSNWSIIGLLLGSGAMAGDLIKSFFKRRMDIKPGQHWVPFDELDFAAGAIIFLSPVYFPGWIDALLILAISFLGHILINLLGFYLNIRRKSEIVTPKYHALVEELGKKMGRLIAGTFLVLFSMYLKNKYGLDFLKNFLFFLILFFLFLDYLRAGLMIKIPFYSQWGNINYEKNEVHPATFALLGLSLALQIAGFDLALAAFSMFVWGDSLAAVIGRGFGRIKLFKTKTWEGSLAMFLFSMMAGAFFIKVLFLLFVLSVLATLIELFLLRVPDALVLPLSIAVLGKLIGG